MGRSFIKADPVTIPPPATSAMDNSIIPSFSYNSGRVPPTQPTAVKH